MSVSVAQVLSLDVFAGHQVAAGASGLSREVRRVNFIDSPLPEDILDEKDIILPGDLFIGSFFMVKDDPARFLSILRVLDRAGCGGLCVINEFLHELPADAARFADQAGLPLVVLDRNVPYGEMLRDAYALILKDKDRSLLEWQLESLLEAGRGEDSVRRGMLNLNPRFRGRFAALACAGPGAGAAAALEAASAEEAAWLFLPFRGKALVLVSADDDAALDAASSRALAAAKGALGPGAAVGVSGRAALGRADRALREALEAAELDWLARDGAVRYAELGLYALLLPLRDQPALKEFRDRVVGAIRDGDAQSSQKLLETAQRFVDCDGDYSQAARALGCHENSVRYRMGRIRSLLGLEGRGLSFLEQLSLAMKLHALDRDSPEGR